MKKEKRAYSLLYKLIFTTIIFSIIIETILVISKAGGISQVYQNRSTVIVVVAIMFIATILIIIFGKNIDSWEKSIDESGSGRGMKLFQILGLWPELKIDQGQDKTFEKFLSVSRVIWWIPILFLIGCAIYFLLIIK